MTFITDNLMKRLAQFRPILHSEADFQHSLAWEIQKTYPNAKVRLEYPYRLLTNNEKDRNALDIWIEDRGIAIELKYKTKKLIENIGGEDYHLKEHKTHNGRYYFVGDIARLERVVETSQLHAGYAVLLTNDDRLWKQSRSPTSASRDFCLHDSLKGKLVWGTGKRKSIRLKHRYELRWVPYSTVAGDCTFNYLIVEVK